jgi:hypothetical protein
MKNIDIALVAPCGMNCRVCLAYLRNNNRCNGCRIEDPNKKKSSVQCVIKNCSLLAGTASNFCYDCEKYPCKRLKDLDKRYRTKYHTSFLENLGSIKTNGIEAFVKNEYDKWRCPTCGGTICIHRGFCLDCQENKIKHRAHEA